MMMMTHGAHVQCHLAAPADRDDRILEAFVLSDLARKLPCDVQVVHGSQHANAKDVLETIDLLAGTEGEVVLEADGPESSRALAKMATILERRFPGRPGDLAVMGLLDLPEEAPPGLDRLSARDRLAAMGLVHDGRAHGQALGDLSPHQELAAFGLLM